MSLSMKGFRNWLMKKRNFFSVLTYWELITVWIALMPNTVMVQIHI